MIINDLLEKENMSRYRLSKESGVPMTTITDICSGKADLCLLYTSPSPRD